MKKLFNKLPKFAGGGVILALLVITIGFVGYYKSCNKVDMILPSVFNSSKQNSNGIEITTDRIKLGKKLENPFKLENMQKAFSNLMNNSKYKTFSENYPIIKPTHKYIKFKPRDADDANYLYHWDTLNMLKTHPLDVEIISSGYNYRDPEVEKYKPTYLYANVPNDLTIPTFIPFEILYETYIPEINNSTNIIKNINSTLPIKNNNEIFKHF